MRKLLVAAALVAATVLAAGSAQAQKVVPKTGGQKLTPKLPDRRPDLAMPSVNWSGDVLYIPVQNKGSTSTGRECKLRVLMFRKVNGTSRLVSTGLSTVPVITPGNFTYVKVQMNQQVVNCGIVIEVDYLNVVAEASEFNNRIEQQFK